MQDAAGKVHVSLVNATPGTAITVTATLAGVSAKGVTGRILTAAAMNAPGCSCISWKAACAMAARSSRRSPRWLNRGTARWD